MTVIKYKTRNKPQHEQTATPDKYPQGYFKEKPCKKCGTLFKPKAPSHLYCSQHCADWALTTRYLRRNYKMTYDDYTAMLDKQEHKCAICGGDGFNLKNMTEPMLVIDHCHDSGKVRGLLCHNCNRALGLLQDNCKVVESALYYLKEHKHD